MAKVGIFRRFPWKCGRCKSQEIIIEPQNDPRDPQLIEVTCKKCGENWFTTGGVWDLPHHVWEELDEYLIK